MISNENPSFFNNLTFKNLSREDLKVIKGASESFNFLNGSGSECLAIFCNSTDECIDVHCRTCQPYDSSSGICSP